MNHRHLLPDEIDLLLDGEEGFGVQPLKAHLASCEGCRSEFEAQREVAVALEGLPHLVPSPLFAERVMREVQIFEPWHVAARDTVRRWLPQSRGARVVAFGGAGVMAVSMTLLTLWLAQRADAVLFVGNLAAERTRGALYDTLHGLLVALLGQNAAGAIASNGLPGFALAATALLVAVTATAFALKTLASAARSKRG